MLAELVAAWWLLAAAGGVATVLLRSLMDNDPAPSPEATDA